MAVQKPKSRTGNSSSTKLTKFTFRWWMAIILIAVIAIIGVVVLQYSHASTADGPAPTGPIYWIGDSLSTGFLVSGNLKPKLEEAGYSPAYINANPGRSITQAGFSPGVNALNAVDADNKNICVGTTVPSIKTYCDAHNQIYNPVKDAKTIVLYIGTNPETDQTKSFTQLQQELLEKLRAINPNARYIWADIAAPGDLAKSTSQDALNFAHLGDPKITVQDLTNSFNAARARLLTNQIAIYSNSIKFKYSIFSQYNFFWHDKFPTVMQFPGITNQKDSQGFVADGTHYTPAGSDKLTSFIVNTLKTGNFAKSPASIIPVDTSQQLKVDLTNPPGFVIVSQTGVKNNGCEQQNGFKSNTNYRGCKVTNTTPIVLTPNPNFKANAQSFLFPSRQQKVCVGSISSNITLPIVITFARKGATVATVSAVYGTANSLAKIIACGTTDKPINEVDTITISTPVLSYLNSITFQTQ